MKFKNNKGFTLVEVIIAICLMGILGILVMNVMIQGSAFYKKIYTNYDTRGEARLAVYYITNRIRENDRENSIYIANDQKIRIVLKENEDLSKEILDIFYDSVNKKLYEGIGTISKLDDGVSIKNVNVNYGKWIKVADISSFKAEEDGESIKVIVGYTDSGKVEKKYIETLALRSVN